VILRHMVRIIDPDGNELDVTARVSQDGLGTLTEALEETFLTLTHGDLDFELVDEDGAVQDFLQGAEPTDVYEVIIDRENNDGDWERLFGGVLDLPWSIQYDRKQRTVSVQVFAYSKLLEQASAELVQRALQGTILVNTTAGSATVTFTLWTTYNVLAGDTIRVSNGIVTEERVVKSITDTLHLETTETWTNTFVDAVLTLMTPYYRSTTVPFLFPLLLARAGITDYDIQVADQDISDSPLPQSFNTIGLPLTEPRSLVEEATKIRLTYPTGNRKDATSLVSGFLDGTASNDCQGDTWPYLGAAGTPMTRAGVSDSGATAWDHPNADYYYIFQQQLGFNYNRLRLRDNASLDTEIIDAGPFALPTAYDYFYVDFIDIGTARHVWVSWKGPGTAGQGIKLYNVDTATWFSIRTDASGQLRAIRGNGIIPGISNYCMAFENKTTGMIEFYDSPTQAIMASIPAPGGSYLWTLRAIPEENNASLVWAHLAMMYQSVGTTRIRLWRVMSLEQVADIQVSSTVTSVPLMTIWQDPATSFYHAILYGGGIYLTLSTKLLGIIPYADFSGMSCAAAVRDLALVSLAYVTVDRFKAGHLKSRANVAAEPQEELPVPIERETIPVWEAYRKSAKITGRDEAGNAISLVAGESGDSARRLELNSNLISTLALLQAIGSMMVAFFGQVRIEENVTISEDGTILRPLDERLLDGVRYMVVEAETGLSEREQDLRLFEVTP